MATTVDDQEILRLKKLSGKKKRSRNCFISSSSLTKEDIRLNQLLDGENTTVYALVEVSKDSEKSAKREKIPLNNKDILHVMQKFMVSKKEKPERKILKPSKRKRVSESASVSTNISKEEKNIQNDALACHALGFSDERSVIYKRSNHSGIERLKSKERDRICRRIYSGDICETEHPHLKILFNRNNVPNQEPRVKRERIDPISRGTNTDIIQTPKVLEEALEALTLNYDAEKACDKLNNIEETNLCLDRCGKDVWKSIPSAAQNFLFVPFIITNNQVAACPKFNAHDPTNGQQKDRDNLETIPVKTDRIQILNDSVTQKCLTHKQSEVKSMNIEQISNATVSEIGTDHLLKKELIDGDMQEEQNKTNDFTDLTTGRGICLLKEVRTLQQRLNAIVEGLETKTFTCLRKLDISNDKKENEVLLNGTCVIEDTDNHSNHEQPFQTNFKDCGVQAVTVTSQCDKMVTVASGTAIYKSMTSRIIQFPSEVKVKTSVRPMTFRKLVPCKSCPLFHTKAEYRYVRMKRASSLLTCSKRVKEADYFQLTHLNYNYEGSLPEDHDQFDEDLELEVFTRKSKDEPRRSEKSTNIFLMKNNKTLDTENGKDKMVTVKQCGKIAKIKIIGNTTLTSENRDSGTGKIKLELNELGSIKISNKFSRKTKKITSNDSMCNTTTTTATNSTPTTIASNNKYNSTNSYSKTAIANVSNKMKDVEGNKRVAGNEKKEAVSRIARRETIQKHVGDVVKQDGSIPKTSAKDSALDSPQSSPRTSKLKKPSTPVRLSSRGKEDGSRSIKSPRIQSPAVPPKAEDNQLIKSPRSVKSAVKLSEKINVCGSSIPKNNLPSPLMVSRGDENPGVIADELESGKTREVPGKTFEEVSNVDKQAPPVKSIWALTKVVLYEDGTQSFEVLEASSRPLKYELNKKSDNVDDTIPNEPTTIHKKNENSDCNTANPRGNGH